jgi:4-hydroxybenzoate polyprenyltransferase
VSLDVTLLPYNEPFLDYLKEQRRRGRRLILTTASNIKFAKQVAQQLGVFDEILASDEGNNLSGAQKLKRLLNAFGGQKFIYAGNSRTDLAIWSCAKGAILVNPERGVLKKAKRLTNVRRVFDDRSIDFRLFLKALRVHQWSKNLLLFVPIVMAHRINETTLVFQAVLAFISFGVCASSVYLLNDLFDLQADRRHPTKRYRPLAVGTLPIKRAVVLIPALLSISAGIASILPAEFSVAIGSYYTITLAYSMTLKQLAIVDVLVLAGLYTLRLIAGAAAVSVTLSFWLVAFSVFIFLSLALAKRYSEILVLRQDGQSKTNGRSYVAVDLETLAQLGTASGYVAVLVLALYINSEQVRLLYSRPEVIWLLCLLVLYWISLVWFLARRNELHEDPVVFAIKDPRGYWLVLIGILVLWTAL